MLSRIDFSAKIVPTQAVTVGLRSEFQSTKAGLCLGAGVRSLNSDFAAREKFAFSAERTERGLSVERVRFVRLKHTWAFFITKADSAQTKRVGL